jgi:uncharacterized protein (DUF362 family)/NAD-dependent dihydropyrimidine dehydrogenase PreA subunit
MIKVIVTEQKTYILTEIIEHIINIFTELKIIEKLENKKTILLKPNMLGAHHPDKAVTTHPMVLEAVIKILQENGKEVIVGDSPGGTVKVSHVWQKCGFQDVCDRYNVRLIDFGKDGMIKVHDVDQTFYFDKYIFECDAIINLAKMKTHSLMLYTGAVKNLYGAIPGLYKTELHKHLPSPNDFSQVLSSVYNIIKPKITLNIIDGIIGMDGEGPSAGKPYNYGVIIACEKASVADYIATRMMGLDIAQIKYLQQSLIDDELSIETIDVDKKWLNFTYPDVNLKVVQYRNRVLTRLPKFIKNIFKSLFLYYPAFLQTCNLCGVCQKSCPVFAIQIKKEKMHLDKKKCIRCMCCHELCPNSAIFLKKRMLAKLVFRR